jgi:amidohydrolase
MDKIQKANRMRFLEEALAIQDETIAMRRDFHRHPELGFKENRTSGIIADTLNTLGFQVATGIAHTGVVGLLRGKADRPVLLLRFDMDALPIQEETGVNYASESPGVMHACGHDSHVAVGLSVAKLLAARRDQLPGTIKFVFQPAEEGDGGAVQMVAAGVLDNPKPDYVMGMHVWSEMPVGWYGLTPGPAMAGGEIFSVKITGVGGHGAAPHKSVDPIIAAAHIITALQTIPSRSINPLDSAVVSVCTVQAGSAFNIIPQEAIFSGTIRTFKPKVLAAVKDRFTRIIHHMAESMGCSAEIQIERVTYPVDNDPDLVGLITKIVREVNPDAVIDSSYQTMGSEDFSFMMQDIPGCFMMIGASNPDAGINYGHHHPKFNIDEACLPTAVAIFTQAAITLLENSHAFT